MNKLNILITSVSRKVSLVNSFQEALKKENISGKVIVADITELTAAMQIYEEHYVVPSTSDSEEFIKSILSICKKEEINLIIPTRDGELFLFAQNKKRFEDAGIKVMVSDPEVIEICNDKYKFFQFLKENDIPSPDTFLADSKEIEFPVIIKPRSGSGSKGILKVKDIQELDFFLKKSSDSIIQKEISGKEYTIDLFSDFDKNIISIIPRERIEVVNGESYKTMTIKDEEIIEYSRKIAEKLGTIGHITLQCMKEGNKIYFIEVNPRFGGAAALGFKAGADTPKFLVQLLSGKKIKPDIGNFKDKLLMLRYTKDIFIPLG